MSKIFFLSLLLFAFFINATAYVSDVRFEQRYEDEYAVRLIGSVAGVVLDIVGNVDVINASDFYIHHVLSNNSAYRVFAASAETLQNPVVIAVRPRGSEVVVNVKVVEVADENGVTTRVGKVFTATLTATTTIPRPPTTTVTTTTPDTTMGPTQVSQPPVWLIAALVVAAIVVAGAFAARLLQGGPSFMLVGPTGVAAKFRGSRTVKRSDLEQVLPGHLLQYVSRSGHFKIVFRGNTAYLVPIRQVSVGGQVVTAPTPLRDGDRIEIGPAVLVFRYVS